MEEQTPELSKDELLKRYKKKAAIQENSKRRSPNARRQFAKELAKIPEASE